MTGVPGALAGLGAIAELRARLLWRRLRGRAGGGEGIALLVLFLLAIPGSLAFAFVVGGSSFRAARAMTGPRVGVTLAAILFGLWQTWTAVSVSLADRDALDVRRFLAFPIPPGRVYAFGLATSALGDPFSVFWGVVLGGVLAGAALARPGAWILLLAATLALFAAATLALVALLQELAARLSRSRHFRVYVLAAAVVGWSLLVVVAAGWLRAPADTLHVLGHVRWLAFPPALAAAAARHLYAGEAAAALPWLALLAASAAATGAAAARVALGTARAGGEGAVAAAKGDGSPGLLGRAPPLLEKELRFLTRHPVVRLQAVLLPVLTGVVAWRASGREGSGAELAAALPLLGVAAYVHLVAQPFWLNAFGWDRGGARLLFLAPVELAAVLRAKNRATLAASCTIFAGCASAALATGAAPPGWAVAGALALHLGLAPALHGAGNAVSIWNPRAAAFGAQRGGRLPALSALAGLAIVSGAAGAFALPVLVAVRLEQPWAMVAGWAAMGAAAYVAYRASLPWAAALLARRGERLLAEVCGEGE